MPEDTVAALTALLLALIAIAAVFDASKGRIPDWVTLPAIGAGLALSGAEGGFAAGRPCLQDALLGAALGAGILALPWAVGGMGAGDVKLMAAVGALSGLAFTVRAALLSALVGAAMALCVAIWTGRFGETMSRTIRAAALRSPHESDRPPLTIPFGLAISLGAAWAILLDLKVIP
ncbi:MAG: prepilin peptidase [Planctomycetota bacterium]